jgi:hypothetical protein
MTILGIKAPVGEKRKVVISLDLEVAQLVRQVARMEQKSVTQCVSDMLSHYVETIHPDWEVVKDRSHAKKGAKR